MRAELFRRVVAAQESERQRIARDLHDETGQSLTAIGMGLRGLAVKLNARNKEAFTTLHKLETLTADSLKELQRLMTDLRPSHLDDLGLSAALRWYATKIQEHSTLGIRVDIHGEERDLDDAMKITIFRIAQECLNNIIKHSHATHVNIHLHFEEKHVQISVMDNGVGFDRDFVQQRRTSRPSLGLAGMEERAALLNGKVSVQSQPGYGTEVEVVIPYHHPGGSSNSRTDFHIQEEVKDEYTPVVSG
jgi:signal transduction histidine kinase